VICRRNYRRPNDTCFAATSRGQPKPHHIFRVVQFSGYTPCQAPVTFGQWQVMARQANGLARRRLAQHLRVDQRTGCFGGRATVVAPVRVCGRAAGGAGCIHRLPSKESRQPSRSAVRRGAEGSCLATGPDRSTCRVRRGGPAYDDGVIIALAASAAARLLKADARQCPRIGVFARPPALSADGPVEGSNLGESSFKAGARGGCSRRCCGTSAGPVAFTKGFPIPSAELGGGRAFL